MSIHEAAAKTLKACLPLGRRAFPLALNGLSLGLFLRVSPVGPTLILALAVDTPCCKSTKSYWESVRALSTVIFSFATSCVFGRELDACLPQPRRPRRAGRAESARARTATCFIPLVRDLIFMGDRKSVV